MLGNNKQNDEKIAGSRNNFSFVFMFFLISPDVFSDQPECKEK